MLLLGISSESTALSDGAEARHLLLEAACIVHLGNALFKSKAQTFLLKAIFINSEYHASTYMVFQRDSNILDDTRPVIPFISE